MIKNKTAIQVWLEFIEKNGRPPTRDEFVQLGYNKTYYYAVKKKYKELQAEG